MNDIPHDARVRDQPQTEEEAVWAMEAWKRRDAEHRAEGRQLDAERDQLVRAAAAVGIENKQLIATCMGISRPTVYKILGRAEAEQNGRNPAQEDAD